MSRHLVALSGAVLLVTALAGSGDAFAQAKPAAPRPGGAAPPAAGQAAPKPPAAKPGPAQPTSTQATPPAAAPATGPRTAGGSGKPGASKAPIVIDADRMEASKKEGLVVFTGGVVAKQENSTQSADRMEVYLDDKGERVMRIVSTGNVRIVTEDCRTGTARRAEYYDDTQRLLLLGDAKVWQDENVVTGDEIEILLAEDKSTVKAGTQGRVKSVFYPKKDDSQAEAGATPAPKKDDKRANCGT